MMKLPLTFAAVIFAHVLLGALLLVQPGCNNSNNRIDENDTLNRGGTGDPQVTGLVGGNVTQDGPVRRPPMRPVGQLPSDEVYQPGVGDGFGPTADGGGTLDPLSPITPLVDLPGGDPMLDGSGGGFPSGGTTYTVQRGDTLWGISRAQGVSLDALLAANGLTRSSVIRVGQNLTIPGGSGGTDAGGGFAVTPIPGQSQGQGFAGESIRYTIKPGDTLSGIAARNGSSVSAIKAANGMTSNTIFAGDSIIVPTNITGSGRGGASSGSKSGVDSFSSPPLSRNSTSTTPNTYVLQSGESLSSVANRFDVTVADLLFWNNISNISAVQPGQTLFVAPPGGVAPRSPQSTTIGGGLESLNDDPPDVPISRTRPAQ
ncbi:MAG: LysM peptidoglycan-binding domain-containing protein [Opitutales bacterium]